MRLKQTLVVILALIVCFSSEAGLQADDPLPETLTVIAPTLNVRMGPGAYTPLLTRLSQGDLIKPVAYDEAGGWWLVRLPNNSLGWVSASENHTRPVTASDGALTASTDPAAVTPQIITPSTQRILVVAPMLNVRVGPGVEFSPVTQVAQGTVLERLEQHQNGWWLVRLEDDTTGWVSNSANYTRPYEYGTYTALPTDNTTGTIILQPFSGGPIYAVNPDGSNFRYLTTGIDPALSPDSSRLAYTTYNPVEVGSYPSEIGTLWVYNMQTGEQEGIMGDVYEPKAPSWSPDGREIVLNYQSGGRQRVIERCQDRDDPIDIPENATVYDVNIGSETGRICFKIFPDTQWRIRKVNVLSGEFEDLNSEPYAFGPTWDPAEPWRIVFYSPSDGLLQLDLNRSEYFPLFSSQMKLLRPVFSPDGSKIAVTIWEHDHWEIGVVDVRNGGITRITEGHHFNEQTSSSAAPAWSPDSRQIIFLTDRNGDWEPWIMNAGGANPHPLLPPEVIAGLDFAYHGVNEQLFSWR